MRGASLLFSLGLLATFSVPLALEASAAEPAAAKPGKPGIALKKWVMSRMRIGKKIEVQFNLENGRKAALRDLRGRLVFYEPLGGKLREGNWTRLGRAEPGRPLPVTLVVGNVPDFGSWEMDLSFRAPDATERFTYFGTSPWDPPQLKTDELLEGSAQAMILGYELDDLKGRRPTLTVRVRNAGAREAREVKICVEFVDKKGKTVSSETVGLDKGGTLEAGETRVFKTPLRKVPGSYGGYRVKALNADVSIEEALSGGEFTSAATVQVAHVKLERLDAPKPKAPRPLRVSAEVKNGTAAPVADCEVVFVFTEKLGGGGAVLRRPEKLAGELAPGAVKPVSFTLERPPAFGGLTYEIEYAEAGGADAMTFPPLTRKVAAGGVGVSSVRAKYDGKVAVFDATVTSRAAVECTEVVVRFTLTKAKGGKQVPVARGSGRLRTIAAGASRQVMVRVEAPDGFEKYSFQVNYTDPSKLRPIGPVAE